MRPPVGRESNYELHVSGLHLWEWRNLAGKSTSESLLLSALQSLLVHQGYAIFEPADEPVVSVSLSLLIRAITKCCARVRGTRNLRKRQNLKESKWYTTRLIPFCFSATPKSVISELQALHLSRVCSREFELTRKCDQLAADIQKLQFTLSQQQSEVPHTGRKYSEASSRQQQLYLNMLK